MPHLTIKHHDKGTVRQRRQPQPTKWKAAAVAEDERPLTKLRMALGSVAVAVIARLFRIGIEVTCFLWSRSAGVSTGLQCTAWLFGDCGLSCTPWDGKSEATSCRWVGDSAGEASSSEFIGHLLHACRAHTGQAGQRSGRKTYPNPCVAWNP